jgi:hypothetical protein
MKKVLISLQNVASKSLENIVSGKNYFRLNLLSFSYPLNVPVLPVSPVLPVLPVLPI